MSADMSQPPPKGEMYAPYGGQPPPPYFSNEASAPYIQQYPGYGAPGFAPNVYENTQGFRTAGNVPMHPQVIIHQQPAQTVIVGPIQYGPNSMRSTCLTCQKDVMTSTNPTPGTLTWVMCILLAFMGLDCGCCLIPFCTNSCQDIEHRCPDCGSFMGMYQRAGRRY